MKDLIRRILKEDDWDWARKVPLFIDGDTTYYIDLIGLNEAERCNVQQKLLEMGIYWKIKQAGVQPLRKNKTKLTNPSSVLTTDNTKIQKIFLIKKSFYY